MKDAIIERLLDQGHITIKIADVILNNKPGKADHVSALRGDSIITNSEAIALLRDTDQNTFLPYQTFPVMPLTYPYTPYVPNTIPVYPGGPVWCSTSTTPNGTAICTSINENFTDK